MTKQHLGAGKYLGVACTVFVLLTLLGCSTTGKSQGPQKARAAAAEAVQTLNGNSGTQRQSSGSNEASTSEQVPAWVGQYPSDPKYYIGVGSAPDTGNPSADIAAAQKRALNELGSQIKTTIRSATTINSSQNSGHKAQESANVSINAEVNLNLEGVELFASYHSKKLGYWYYYRLPKTALDPRSIVAVAVGDLTKVIHGSTRISFGPITYSNSGLPSAFSEYLHNQILLALKAEKAITVSAKPVVLSPQAGNGSSTKTKTVDRGLTVEGSTAHGLVLTGTFFGSSRGKISVFLRLTDPKKETVIDESSFSFDGSLLPSGMELAPANYATASAAKEAVASVGASGQSGLQIRLWTERGQAPVYRDGQDLVLNFTTNHDCYLKMYHIDVNGRVSLILPNRYSQNNFFHAGRVYRIPPQGAPYRFRLGAPYGVESIKVIASTRQFRSVEPAFTDLGRATRGLLTRGLEVMGTGPVETAQAMVSYTILAK